MAIETGYLSHVVARLGLASQVGAASLVPGEIAYTQDDKVFHVGDNTASPPRVMTTKSTGDFSFETVNKVTMPGGAVFDKSKAFAVDGVALRKLNANNGFLVRRGDNDFVAIGFKSSDQSILVQGGSGTQGAVDLRINPDSDIVKQLFDGIGVLGIDAINGLQAAIDSILQGIVNAKNEAVSTVRGGVSTNMDTLKKVEDFLASSTVVIGDPSNVAAAVLTIIRDGVRTNRNTLKKISDDLDATQARVTSAEEQLAAIGGGGAFNQQFYAITSALSGQARTQLIIIDRMNKENNAYDYDY